jgi:hypothetical protein
MWERGEQGKSSDRSSGCSWWKQRRDRYETKKRQVRMREKEIERQQKENYEMYKERKRKQLWRQFFDRNRTEEGNKGIIP